MRQLQCDQCQILFNRKEAEIRRASLVGAAHCFCSRRCHVTYQNKAVPKRKPEGICISCGKSASTKYKKCTTCRQKLRAEPKRYLSWPRIKNQIIEERGRKCEKCGWAKPHPLTGEAPVQVNHKDGNRQNNDRTNLEILCPNCHSLTPNFMFYGRSHGNTYGQKGTSRWRSSHPPSWISPK